MKKEREGITREESTLSTLEISSGMSSSSLFRFNTDVILIDGKLINYSQSTHFSELILAKKES